MWTAYCGQFRSCTGTKPTQNSLNKHLSEECGARNQQIPTQAVQTLRNLASSNTLFCSVFTRSLIQEQNLPIQIALDSPQMTVQSVSLPYFIPVGLIKHNSKQCHPSCNYSAMRNSMPNKSLTKIPHSAGFGSVDPIKWAIDWCKNTSDPTKSPQDAVHQHASRANMVVSSQVIMQPTPLFFPCFEWRGSMLAHPQNVSRGWEIECKLTITTGLKHTATVASLAYPHKSHGFCGGLSLRPTPPYSIHVQLLSELEITWYTSFLQELQLQNM